MSTKDISVNRDRENDVLCVFDNRFERSKTVNRHVNSDIAVRIDGRTHKVYSVALLSRLLKVQILSRIIRQIVNLTMLRTIAGFTITDFGTAMPRLKDLTDYELMEEFDFIINSLNTIHSLEHKKS